MKFFSSTSQPRATISIMKHLLLIVALLSSLIFVNMPTKATAAPMALYGQTTSATSGVATTSGWQTFWSKAKSSWPWYLTRAAGLTAAVLLLILIIFGIGLITGYTYRIMEPIVAWQVHRALAIAFGVSVCVHIIALLFDKFVPFNILQVLIPFTSHYHPVTIAGVHLGSFDTALGILAFYIAGVTILTSLFWMERKPSQWRLLHYLNYVLVALVFIHGLFMGSDLLHGTLRNIWVSCGVIILAAAVLRIRRVRTINR